MKATIYHGPGDVRVEEVPDAALREPNDAVVRVTRAGICGSDLWFFRGQSLIYKPGYRVGRHDEVSGTEVAHLRPDLLDDPEELVPDAVTGFVDQRLAAEEPEIRAADPGAGDADDDVGGLSKGGVRNLLDADVSGPVVDRRPHSAADLTAPSADVRLCGPSRLTAMVAGGTIV